MRNVNAETQWHHRFVNTIKEPAADKGQNISLCLFSQLEGELNLAPGFPIPPNSDYKTYHNYIDEVLPAESPYLYGLHPNAEIGFLTATSDNLFRTVLEMQPRDAGAGSGGGQTREEKVGYHLLHRDPQGSFLF